MINKKKIMQSVSLIVLTAVLYGNAYAPKKDMPQPDFKGFTKACATQEMIASSLHNADYITSTHPNTGFLDANNEHEVSVEQNNTPVVTEAASSQAIEWSGPVLYANNYCQVYADKEMTQPLFTLNYNDAAQVSGMVSTSEIQVTVYVPPFEYQRIFKVTPMKQKGVTAEELLGTAPAQQSQEKKARRVSIGPAKKSVPADGYSAVAENKHFNKSNTESKVRNTSVTEMMGVTPDENGNVRMKDVAEKNPEVAEKMGANLLDMCKKSEAKVDENNQVSFLGNGTNGNLPIISEAFDDMI